MRAFTMIFLLLVLEYWACAQCDVPTNASKPDANPKQFLYHSEQFADKAHQDGRFDEELECRMQLSKFEWETIAQSPRVLDKYDVYNLMFLNDLPLAFLLEGKHRWSEAENIYRHSRQQLAHMSIAGDDIKSDNELGLGHLLFSMGRMEESARICSHWKNRVRHNADFAINAVKTNIPTPPLYDTPEVEIGRWNLACGEAQVGEDMLRTQILAHPDMLAPYTALANYYLEIGAFSKALELEGQKRRLWNRSRN
jgi:hypothetical protein